MDLIVSKQHLRHTGGLRIVAAPAGVQGAQLRHLSFGQFKVEDVQVSGDPPRVGGLGQYDEPVLHLKAADDLSGVLAVVPRQLGTAGVVDTAEVALA